MNLRRLYERPCLRYVDQIARTNSTVYTPASWNKDDTYKMRNRSNLPKRALNVENTTAIVERDSKLATAEADMILEKLPTDHRIDHPICTVSDITMLRDHFRRVPK